MLQNEIVSLYAAAIMVFAALVPVLNPFGGAMFFLTLTNGVDPQIRRTMANQIGLYSVIVLMVCLFKITPSSKPSTVSRRLPTALRSSSRSPRPRCCI